jgi:2-methylcitrate dehydratase PrpD
MTASAAALDGPQGFLAAMASQFPKLDEVGGDLGTRWEILDTGITVKLYPSCAGTHPTLDAIIDLVRQHAVGAGEVDAIEIGVDPVVPTILIYDRPASGLEAKFSMPFCAAAAVVHRRVGIDTFDAAALTDPAILALQQRVTMRVDPTLDASALPLTQANVAIRLRDGRVLRASANGARGYPERPASERELDDKFMACAAGVLPDPQARALLAALKTMEQGGRSVRDLFSIPERSA